MGIFARFLTIGACLVGLSACEDSTSGEVSKSLLDNPAARQLEAQQVFLTMRDLCLHKPVTFVEAKDVTQHHKIGLSIDLPGWDDFNHYGKARFRIQTDPSVLNGGGLEDVPKGTVFNRYSCSADFSGTWADEFAVELGKELTANGFQTVKPISRATGTTSVGTKTVAYTGTYRRDGVNFKVEIMEAGGTTKRTYHTVTHYISGTRVRFTSL